MNTDTIKRIFQSPFDYTTYCNEIVHNIFGCNDIASSPEELPSSSDGDQNYFIGRMADADSRELGFFYTRVAEGSDVRRKRVGLRKLIQPYLKYEVDAAIAVFDDGNHWRLSYICDMKEGVTAAKRFSYILGDPQGQYKTPIERLSDLGTQASSLRLCDIRDAFSVETLSKEFFDEYHRHYDAICDYMVKHVEEFSIFNSQLSILHDYVKKMLGRIVFLHFLQKKGWLNGNQYFLRDLYFMSPHQADFLEQVLEPLFFGIFNTEPGNREQVFRDNGWDVNLLHQWNGENTQNSDFQACNSRSSESTQNSKFRIQNSKIRIQNSPLPYLNGGLFERDKVDDLNIKLPASLFENLFTFLASYNFTVDENDPDDAEVGVDPEMLGKIFESLLEDNKAKGAFYTPKEIVRYMCKESLIAYLSSRVSELPCPAGRNLVNLVNSADASNCERSKANNNLQDSQDFANETSRSIRRFVEHHEFPSELEPYRDTLDSALRNVKICDPAIGSGAFPMGLLNELWRCREALAIREANNLQDLQDFVSAASRSKLKKEIIENNIYGVDIERGAIDIARLRFWLSIVVDAEEPEPLPNFDYKFMQGNSLIESYKGIDLSRISNRLRGGQSKSTQLLLGLDSDFSKKNLQRLMRDYFSVTDHKQKASMRQAINDEVKRLITDFIGGTSSDLDKLDPSANQDFFLWHTWFKDIFDNGGFDIVISNPPYIDYRKIDNITKSGLGGYKSYQIEKKGSLYVYFIEKGINLLKSFARLFYINPYQYLSAESGRGIRSFVIPRHNIERIVDISNIKVFDDACTYTCINIIQNNSEQGDIVLLRPNALSYLDENITNVAKATFIDKPFYTIALSTNSIVEKTEKAKYRLSDICSIFCGLSKTGFRNHVSSSKENNDFQIFVESKQIHRYVTDSKKYIDTKIFSYNAKRAFDTPCLFMTRMTSRCRVAIAKKGETAGKVNVLHNFKNSSILLVLALLNSKVVDYYYRITNESKHLNGGALPFDTESVKAIPMPKASIVQQQEIESLVKQIIDAKNSNPNANTLEIEYQIDKLVYQLYNLTPDEIAIIEQ